MGKAVPKIAVKVLDIVDQDGSPLNRQSQQYG